jgi:hypothetical protein
MIRKGFKNTMKPCYYIFTNFELGNNMIILFKLRDIFPKASRSGFQVVIQTFQPTKPVCFYGGFNQFEIIINTL